MGNVVEVESDDSLESLESGLPDSDLLILCPPPHHGNNHSLRRGTLRGDQERVGGHLREYGPLNGGLYFLVVAIGGDA